MCEVFVNLPTVAASASSAARTSHKSYACTRRTQTPPRCSCAHTSSHDKVKMPNEKNPSVAQQWSERAPCQRKFQSRHKHIREGGTISKQETSELQNNGNFEDHDKTDSTNILCVCGSSFFTGFLQYVVDAVQNNRTSQSIGKEMRKQHLSKAM